MGATGQAQSNLSVTPAQTASSSLPIYSQPDAASSSQNAAPQSNYITYNSQLVSNEDLQREIERFMQPGWDPSAYTWLTDSPALSSALGSQMPSVETEPEPDVPLLSPIYDGRPSLKPPVKLTWWRPCGRTAIEPGCLCYFGPWSMR